MKLHLVLIAVAITIAGSGCATNRSSEQSFETGKLMIESGRVEEGLQKVNAAAKANPQNVEYRAYYVRTRYQYGNQLLTQGDKLRLLGKIGRAHV